MPRITELCCYAICDQDEDDEGVAVVLTDGGWIPLVGANMERMKSYRESAQALADASGKPVRLYRFPQREEVEVLEPKGAHA